MSKQTAQTGIPRVCEIAIAAGGLVITAPVLAISAILIKITSRGPIVFSQQRVGLHGKSFTLFKLRTMSIAKEGSLVTAANDVRVTPVGKVLRKTKIDELPGLWNVVRGDMSFVGPRPEVPELVDLSDPRWQEILETRPGITDPVTLSLRNEEGLLARVADKERFYRDHLQPYKLTGYLEFVRRKNWKTDIGIIGGTLKAIVLPNTAREPTPEELGWVLGE